MSHELTLQELRERIQAAGITIAENRLAMARKLLSDALVPVRVLEQVDVLATPTGPKPATPFTLAHDPDFGFPRSNMPPFNITGLPALALPCGFSSAGLPLSLQLAGRPFDEALVLRVGDAYEQATEWHARRPPV